MIYLYAIIEAPRVCLPAVAGLEGDLIEALSYRDIGAVIGSLTMAEAPPTEANLWLHEAVLEELMADYSVLPVRFGTTFADVAAVRAELEAHYAGFVADLERLRGHVELGLRARWDDPLGPASDNRPPISSSGGRAYMLARVEQEHDLAMRRQQAEAVAASIHDPLASLAHESTSRVLIDPSPYLTASYLVRREWVAAFRREVESLGSAHPDIRLICTGPWPPFNFVTAKPIEDREGSKKW